MYGGSKMIERGRPAEPGLDLGQREVEIRAFDACRQFDSSALEVSKRLTDQAAEGCFASGCRQRFDDPRLILRFGLEQV